MTNRQGFSLVQVMVAMGMVSALSLIALSLTEAPTRQLAQLGSKTEVLRLQQIFQQALSSNRVCGDVLAHPSGGKRAPWLNAEGQVSTGSTSGEYPVSLSWMSILELKEGLTLALRISVEELRWQPEAGPVLTQAAMSRGGVVRLKLRLPGRSPASLGQAYETRLPLAIRTNDLGEIVSCAPTLDGLSSGGNSAMNGSVGRWSRVLPDGVLSPNCQYRFEVTYGPNYYGLTSEKAIHYATAVGNNGEFINVAHNGLISFVRSDRVSASSDEKRFYYFVNGTRYENIPVNWVEQLCI